MEKNDGIHLGSSPSFSTILTTGRYRMIIDNESTKQDSHSSLVNSTYYGDPYPHGVEAKRLLIRGSFE